MRRQRTENIIHTEPFLLPVYPTTVESHLRVLCPGSGDCISVAEPSSSVKVLKNVSKILRPSGGIEQEGKGVLVEHDGSLFSVKIKRSRTKTKKRAITSQDSILHIVGIGASQGPTDTSTNKHRYLAEASGDLHNL